ncbi:MAG: sugar ABC transporter permease [Actinomycetaceae bacterium]|nr:sugar ABC transporter permease [Actinomycetaceae bacterium]
MSKKTLDKKKWHTSLTGVRWWKEVGWRHIVGILVIVYCIIPLLYVLSASLKPGSTLTGSNQMFSQVAATNYANLMETNFWRWMLNSIIVAGITAFGSVLMVAAAAYAFSRFRFKGRRGTLTFLLLVQMFPQMLAFVAIYLLLLNLQNVFPILGLDSLIGLICVYLGAALGTNTFLMYGFFNSIPQTLDEAAEIDGCTHAQVYWRIVLPMVVPILAVVGLLGFISSFGDFILASVILQKEENLTLAVGMYRWASDAKQVDWGQFAAGAVIAAIPIILLFQFLQKYIVSGLTAGSVKG